MRQPAARAGGAAPNGHRSRPSTRRSTAREQRFSVLCDCRLQRTLGSAGGGSAALRRDARGTCSSALRRGVRAAPALAVSLPDAEQLVAPLFRLRVPAEDYAANDVTYYVA